MADIDMIPRSYREGLRVRRTLAAYGAALGLLLVAGLGTSAFVRWRLALETPRLEQARAGTLQADALRTRLTHAQLRKDGLAEGVAALAALRGAGEAEALARLLDRALNERVWFERLRFSRSQEQLQPAPSPLPPEAAQVQVQVRAQAWRLGSHLEIDGRALDNAAMTSFLAQLAADPALANVRFLNSSMQTAEEGGAVAFGVTASLVKRKDTP